MKLPHFDPHMDFKTYLADPADEPSLTSSLARALLSTAPRKVWEETKRLNKDAKPKDKTAFDLGTAAHEYFTSDGVGVVELDFKAFNTNAAKEARDAVRAAGKTPILKANMGRVKAMAVAAWEQMEQNQEEIPDLRAADPETSIFWQEDGVTCRARPDFYNIEADVMYHYKTTAVKLSELALAKHAANSKWHLTAAHYAAAGQALTGRPTRQVFIVQEVDAPHLLITCELDATFMETGIMRRRRALYLWGRCLTNKMWPGFTSHTVKLEMPEWEERNETDAKDAENDASSVGKDLLDIATRWQAPEDK